MPEDNSPEEEDKPVISDRMQYLLGTLISIVLVVGYLGFSGELTGSADSGVDQKAPPAVSSLE